MGGAAGTVPLRVMLAPVVALDLSHEGRDVKDQAYGAVPPEAVQLVEYCAPGI